MKRRYSPEARRAHLAHMRAKYGKSSVVSVQEVLPDPIKKLIEAYQGGFLTAVELADLILQTLPQPENPIAQVCIICDKPFIPQGNQEVCKQCLPEVYACPKCGNPKASWRPTCVQCQMEAEQPKPDPKPEEDDDGLPLPTTKHDEGCQCHLCWVASLTPPSPPWKAPENQPPAGVAQWEWELGKTDPAQNICGYCGAPYYPGNAVYCASCTPREGGAA